MDASTVAAIAQEVVKQEILGNWEFYVIELGIVVLGVAGTNFVGAYFKGRGAAIATKADFEDLLRQVRTTTETTESIKRTISHEDWRIREFKTLRRSKLEELMLCLYDVHHWLERERDFCLYASPKNELADPMNRVEVIAGLYFPELESEIMVFHVACLAYKSWANEARQKLAPLLLTDRAEYIAQLPLVVANYSKVYAPMLSATTAVEKTARTVMKEVLGVAF